MVWSAVQMMAAKENARLLLPKAKGEYDRWLDAKAKIVERPDGTYRRVKPSIPVRLKPCAGKGIERSPVPFGNLFAGRASDKPSQILLSSLGLVALCLLLGFLMGVNVGQTGEGVGAFAFLFISILLPLLLLGLLVFGPGLGASERLRTLENERELRRQKIAHIKRIAELQTLADGLWITEGNVLKLEVQKCDEWLLRGFSAMDTGAAVYCSACGAFLQSSDSIPTDSVCQPCGDILRLQEISKTRSRRLDCYLEIWRGAWKTGACHYLISFLLINGLNGAILCFLATNGKEAVNHWFSADEPAVSSTLQRSTAWMAFLPIFTMTAIVTLLLLLRSARKWGRGS